MKVNGLCWVKTREGEEGIEPGNARGNGDLFEPSSREREVLPCRGRALESRQEKRQEMKLFRSDQHHASPFLFHKDDEMEHRGHPRPCTYTCYTGAVVNHDGRELREPKELCLRTWARR